MNRFLIIAILCFTASAQALKLGGSSDGGGNAIDGRLIEEFQIYDITSLKGYDVFKERLEFLRTKFPELARELDNGLKKKTWYLIPREFDQLPVEETGLHFDSDQVAYQNDREIFVSQPGLERLQERSAGLKIMHEVMMASQKVRDVSKVRLAAAPIFNPKASVIDMQNALAANGFGVYFTSHQMKRLRESARKHYVSEIASVLKLAQYNCSADFEETARRYHPKNQSALQYQWDVIIERLLTPYGGTDPQWPAWQYNGPIGGFNYDKREKVDFDVIGGGDGFYSPFRASAYYAGLYYVHRNVRALANMSVFSACYTWKDEMPQQVCEQFRDEIRAYDELAKKNEVSIHRTAIGAAINLGEWVEKDTSRLRTDLAERNSAFPHMLALLSHNGLYMSELREQYSYSPVAMEGQAILDQANRIRLSLGNRKLADKIRMLCDDMNSLERDLSGLYQVLAEKERPRSAAKAAADDTLPTPRF